MSPLEVPKMSAAAPFRIAVWGPPQSGKTVFVASLNFAHCKGWRISVAGDSFLNDVLMPLADNMPPQPTMQLEGMKESVVCSFRKLEAREDAPLITIEIEDRAGEEWERVAKARGAESDKNKPMLGILASSSAAILLYDLNPKNTAENLELIERIGDVISGLWHGEGNPIAVCLTKCDLGLRSAEAVIRARRDPESAVGDLIPKARFEKLAEQYRHIFRGNVKFFPVSSLGLRMVYGAVAPVTFIDELGQMRVVSGTPEERAAWQINLTEPFVWVFERLGLV